MVCVLWAQTCPPRLLVCAARVAPCAPRKIYLPLSQTATTTTNQFAAPASRLLSNPGRHDINSAIDGVGALCAAPAACSCPETPGCPSPRLAVTWLCTRHSSSSQHLQLCIARQNLTASDDSLAPLHSFFLGAIFYSPLRCRRRAAQWRILSENVRVAKAPPFSSTRLTFRPWSSPTPLRAHHPNCPNNILGLQFRAIGHFLDRCMLFAPFASSFVASGCCSRPSAHPPLDPRSASPSAATQPRPELPSSHQQTNRQTKSPASSSQAPKLGPLLPRANLYFIRFSSFRHRPTVLPRSLRIFGRTYVCIWDFCRNLLLSFSPLFRVLKSSLLSLFHSASRCICHYSLYDHLSVRVAAFRSGYQLFPSLRTLRLFQACRIYDSSLRVQF